VTEADGLRHVARTPMRGAAGGCFRRANDHLLHLLLADRAFGARSRLIVEPVEAVR